MSLDVHAVNTPTAIIGSILLPVTGFLIKSAWDFLRRFSLLEVRVEATETEQQAAKATAKETHEQLQETNTRVTRTEAAISELRGHVQRADEQFAIISVKLDQIPRLATLLEIWQTNIESIVPRQEVDDRKEAVDQRTSRIEGDIRELRDELREIRGDA